MSAETTPSTGKGPGTPRWMKLALVASLTVNLAVLGIIGGAHFRDYADGREAPPQADKGAMRNAGFGPFFDAMPRELRSRAADELRARGGMQGPDRGALAQDLRDIVAALKAEPYDGAALAAVLEDQHQRIEDQVSLGRTVLLDQVAAMSPADRAAFADRIAKGFRRAMEGGPPPGN